jgi:hypothetical protein
MTPGRQIVCLWPKSTPPRCFAAGPAQSGFPVKSASRMVLGRRVPGRDPGDAIPGSIPDSIVKQRRFLTSPRLRGPDDASHHAEVASILRAGEGAFQQSRPCGEAPPPKPSATAEASLRHSLNTAAAGDLRSPLQAG